ncbi:hypothetical protein CCOS865_03590 [Pseudomonas reidholzensis]|uniref:Uncharacterized protein n=1 Tax=Pseudomonas reidholzensis TaxID=1785162 RepID=A0A383RY04_9PSED|nr:methyltransferase domain-containing protein [Pseudomonas reidholzensis]SYX91321.1 hypothetical protein CCOS865_03590 [Pseudomonas reidholzensis]
MSNNQQGQVARQFWSQTERGQIGPAQLYERQRDCLLTHVLPSLPADAQVLDIGCADGEFSLLFAQIAARVVAFDVGEKLIDQARQKAREQQIDNVEFHVADVFQFSCEERFDAVSLMGVLTTISDDTAAARVVLRALALLKPGGQLILKDSVLLQGSEARTLLNDQYEAKYRPESRYLALIRSLGLREVARHPLLTMHNCGQTSVLYVFQPVLSESAALPIAGLRVACYGSMPFHFRSLRPLAACFETSLLSLSIEEVMQWQPQVIVVADGWSVEFWRDYCDAHQVLLIGMRHGSVTRYGFAEQQYNHADYLCGSVWDIEDTLLSNVHPRHGFLLTGNAWVDQVFRLPARPLSDAQPTILFAPTYNPEISAAVYFGERIVPLIRSVYPRARIIIKPHPAIVQHEHSFVVDKALFRDLMGKWRLQVAADPLLELVDDPEASIADSFAEADILVADRSSLLFEFMALDRPILLYSSEARVGHWEYNPDAPGNAWRDIGMEFGDDQAFLELLGDAFNLHQTHCRAAQRERVQQLYGDFADGRSAERVASAIAQAPRLHVVIDGRHGADAAQLYQAFEQTLAFKHISLLGSQAEAQQWLTARAANPGADHSYLLVDGDFAGIPGSAHQISDGLAALASGALDGLVLNHSGVLPVEAPATDSQAWVRERLRAALQQWQGQQAWQLLPAHTLHRSFEQLPSAVDDEVFSTLWQTLNAGGQQAQWQSDKLNVVLRGWILRIVGGTAGRYFVGPNAALQLTPAVIGQAPSTAAVEVLLGALPGQQYDVFPFTTQVWVNGRYLTEVTLGNDGAQRLLLPYQPNEYGVTDIELRSSGAFPGMSGLAGPLSLQLAFVGPAAVAAPARAHIHQIFYSDETRALLEPGYTPLDNVGQRPDWAEYWPMRNLLMDKPLDENAFYGVLSPRFKQKTGLDAEHVLRFVESAPDDADVLLFPVFFPDGARYENIFIQALVHHPNIWPVCVEMARQVAPGVDLETLVMDSKQAQFCNYFIAKPRFWRHWFSKAESIFQAAELARDGQWSTPYGQALNMPTLHRGTQGYECKVFVMERLLSLLLATDSQWRVHVNAAMLPSASDGGFTPQLIELDQLKSRLREADTAEGRQAYLQLREQVFCEIYAQPIAEIIANGGQVATATEQLQAAMRQFPLLPAALDVPAWLAERTPTAAQQVLIDERLANGMPRIGVLVLDREGDADRLDLTLRSLSPEHNRYPGLSIVVLSALELGAATSAQDKLHILRIGSEPLHPLIDQAVREAGFDWFMLVEAGSEFTASGLLVAALDMLGAPGLRAVYGDEVLRVPGLGEQLAMRPGLNLDMLLSLPGVMARHWLFSRDAWLQLGGFNAEAGAAVELDLILRLIEDQGLEGLGHVSEPLLISDSRALLDCPDQRATIERHLLARGFEGAAVAGRVPGHYELNYGVGESALVSILVSTEYGLERVRRCLDTLLDKTTYRTFEVVLLDQGADDPDLQAWLDGVEQLGGQLIKVVRLPADLSSVQVRNVAAQQAQGELLLWLHAGIAVLETDWLQQLVNHACRQEVGVVGAKLLASDCTVRHGGLVLGLDGPVGRVFRDLPMAGAGYLQRLLVDQNHAAVSGHCMMMGKALFMESGGFDESPELAAWADVDLCLRLHAAGYLNVWTPRAALLISETPEPAITREQEQALYTRWLPLLARDPAYSTHFALNAGKAFQVAPSRLSWDPLSSWRPLPKVLACAVEGETVQRTDEPLQALRRAGLADGATIQTQLSVAELERYAPDSVVLQSPLGHPQIERLQRLSAFSRAFKVLEPVLALGGESGLAHDQLRGLQLAFADRLVVANEALADALAASHSSIVVVPDMLDPQHWSNLGGRRRIGAKPRVGLIGDAADGSDLAVVEALVMSLAGEVEWVLLGNCSDVLRPYLTERHTGLRQADYAQQLARLDLDLALAPLRPGLLRNSQSSLRLLELGACGVPVISSAHACDRGELPVTLVDERLGDWLDAVRMHLHDLDATGRLGDALRAQVLQHCMLEGDNLQRWRKAWLAD